VCLEQGLPGAPRQRPGEPQGEAGERGLVTRGGSPGPRPALEGGGRQPGGVPGAHACAPRSRGAAAAGPCSDRQPVLAPVRPPLLVPVRLLLLPPGPVVEG